MLLTFLMEATTMTLKEKALELQREYIRTWQQKNKDRVREYRRKYWLHKAREALKAEKELSEKQLVE